MDELKQELKKQVVENLMLELQPDEIRDDQAFFDPQGLGLDSVDALQLVVMLDKLYGIKIEDADLARNVLKSIQTMADHVERHRAV